ncbi:hypothetical protein FRB99_004416 [Tulasnella sp. 403]|nr:hypothetical protein FRB99_004416 [Tulasnella sp. 403]
MVQLFTLATFALSFSLPIVAIDGRPHNPPHAGRAHIAILHKGHHHVSPRNASWAMMHRDTALVVPTPKKRKFCQRIPTSEAVTTPSSSTSGTAATSTAGNDVVVPGNGGPGVSANVSVPVGPDKKPGDKDIDPSNKSSKDSNNDSKSSSDNTGNNGSDGPLSGLLDALFPADGFLEAWTTHTDTTGNAKLIKLDDDTFIIDKESKALKHPVVKEDGVKAIQAFMAKGSYTLRDDPVGGFSFYTPGPKGDGGKPVLDLTKALEVSFAYRVKFSDGYGFEKGGKMPGMYGGTSEDAAEQCSGGEHDEPCFSTRFMFREKGKGELYLYIPPDANRDNLCGDDGTGRCRKASANGKTYGASMGTGLWVFKAGEWITLRQVIHLNTPGKRDGWAKVYIDGSPEPVLDVQDLSFRESKSGRFWGLQMQMFHGGHDESWAAPHDQWAWYSGLTVAITAYDN